VGYENSAANNRKLSEWDIPIIFRLKERGYTAVQISQAFNVKPNTIQCVLLGRTWKHVTRR